MVDENKWLAGISFISLDIEDRIATNSSFDSSLEE